MAKARRGILAAAVAFAASPQGRKLLVQAKDFAARPENRQRAQQAIQQARAKRRAGTSTETPSRNP